MKIFNKIFHGDLNTLIKLYLKNYFYFLTYYILLKIIQNYCIQYQHAKNLKNNKKNFTLIKFQDNSMVL